MPSRSTLPIALRTGFRSLSPGLVIVTVRTASGKSLDLRLSRLSAVRLQKLLTEELSSCGETDNNPDLLPTSMMPSKASFG